MSDTIYTERYMGTPASNPDGYNESAVHNVTGFNAIDFALAHGSGDDNGTASVSVFFQTIGSVSNGHVIQFTLRIRPICWTYSPYIKYGTSASGCSLTGGFTILSDFFFSQRFDPN